MYSVWKKEIQNSIQLVLVIIGDWVVNKCMYLSLNFLFFVCLFWKHHMITFSHVLPLSDELIRKGKSQWAWLYCKGLSIKWQLWFFFSQRYRWLLFISPPGGWGKPPLTFRSLPTTFITCLIHFIFCSLKSRIPTWPKYPTHLARSLLPASGGGGGRSTILSTGSQGWSWAMSENAVYC